MEPRRQADRVPAGEELKYSRLRPEQARGRSRRPAAQPRHPRRRRSIARSAQPQWSTDGSSLAFLVVDDRSQYRSARRCRPSRPAQGRAADRPAKSVVGNLSAGGQRRRASPCSPPTRHELPEVARARGRQAAPAVAPERRAGSSEVQLGDDRGVHVDEQGRHRGARPDRQAARPTGPGRSIRRCCASTAARTARTSTRSASSASCSRPTATSCVAVNYRGSNGRGSAYQKAIFADWGNKEVVDLLGAMDHVQKHRASPIRTGSASAAGATAAFSTDYTIATDTRFKAAISGAGSALQLSMYGIDQYITQYEHGARPAVEEPGRCGSRSRIRSSTPTGSRRRRCSWAARRTSTCRSSAASRCTRRCEPRRRHAAGDLPGPVPRHHDAELQDRSAPALPGLVRQVSEAGNDDDDDESRPKVEGRRHGCLLPSAICLCLRGQR